jgi:cullin-5
MFRLLDRIPDNVEPMLQYLEIHIVTRGLADMVASAATIAHDCEKYVEALLTAYNTFSQLVKTAFSDDPRFLTARDKAFKVVVNSTKVFSLDVPTKPVSIER